MKFHSIQHAITALACSLLFGLAFLLASASARAQDEVEQIELSFKKLNPEDEARLRSVLSEPFKKNAVFGSLDVQLREKLNAAKILGDEYAIREMTTEALSIINDPRVATVLGDTLMRTGDFEKALQIRRMAITSTGVQGLLPSFQGVFTAKLARDYAIAGYDNEAEAAITQAASAIMVWPPILMWQRSPLNEAQVYRSRSIVAHTKSMLAARRGHISDAIDLANQAVLYARQDVGALRNNVNEYQTLTAYQNFAQVMQFQLLLMNGFRKPGVEKIAKDYLSLLQSKVAPPALYADALSDIGSLRFTQKEFNSAISFYQQSFQRLVAQNVGNESPFLMQLMRDMAISLVGLGRYKKALVEFQKLDQLAGEDERLKARVRYRFDRAVVYLYNNKAAEASLLLALESEVLAKQYGMSPTGKQHFFTAQASGLQGVALWRIGTSESKAQAYPLLQASVQSIMSPENLDYLENIGIRKELREMIFSTYIEAVSQSSRVDALAALGIADWLRGGLVQEALSDAAIRASATNEALTDLVRQDQDAKNEIKGLRNFLSGEAGGAQSPLPEIAAKIRERISVLEKSRANVQVKIKATFPDYDKLVRPLPLSTTDIQARLKVEEALIVLQPTEHATYVWVVNSQGTGQFYRAPVSEAALKLLVVRLRATLDVAGQPTSRMPAFDHAASQDLYQKLLAPVQSGLQGKTSLIVAAGGVLGQIPFGVLQTQPFDKRRVDGVDVPWLIQHAAITHVPTVAAWLSMRSLRHTTAPESMLAWGDPLFNIALANSPTTSKSEARKVDITRANTAVDLQKEDPRSAIKYANIPALPETRDELTAIAKTLGADLEKDLIMGSAATRESVIAFNKNGSLAKRRVLAFATHGLMAGDLPNLTQPALAMAGTKDDPTNVLAPLLTLEDVLGLKLNADWVVLSACNTAAADGKAEEALSGLARGFFYAGSRSLLVTHWAVDSDSAVTLTTETFKHYQANPQAPKAESLRQAMLKVMSYPKTAHPAYWAPYVLVGDGAR